MQAVRSFIARRLVGAPSHGMTIRSGAREDMLLAKDPALNKYHSVKNTVSAIKRFGDVLVILAAAVLAGHLAIGTFWRFPERNSLTGCPVFSKYISMLLNLYRESTAKIIKLNVHQINETGYNIA